MSFNIDFPFIYALVEKVISYTYEPNMTKVSRLYTELLNKIYGERWIAQKKFIRLTVMLRKVLKELNKEPFVC